MAVTGAATTVLVVVKVCAMEMVENGVVNTLLWPSKLIGLVLMDAIRRHVQDREQGCFCLFGLICRYWRGKLEGGYSLI